jgi:choline-sulfatase
LGVRGSSGAQEENVPQLPNILWIQTDEQRADSLGCYGNAHVRVRTPHIDALARRGTRFANHHVQSPVCVPSRVCELTSHYAYQTGILNNSVHYTWGRWPEGLLSFPELFAQGGYVTASFGKYHTPHHHTWLENWHFEMFADEATHGHLAPRFEENAHEVIHLGHRKGTIIVSGRYPDTGHTPQTHLTDNALDWLRLYAHVRRPFLLRVSFLAPHTPVLAPEPFYSMYDPREMDWDVPAETLLKALPRYERGRTEAYHKHTDEELRRMRGCYYGLVSHVDQQVGRLISELEQLGELDNTLVVYSSDHGCLLGEYGQFQKCVFYDITTRVPFLLSGPGIPAGERVDALTEQVDLAPTLLRLAGLPVPNEMQGRDLLTGKPRRDVIGQIQLHTQGVPTRRSWIRTERWSLDVSTELDGRPTSTPGERDGKLIDLLNDPLEQHNLYYDEGYCNAVRELEERLAQRTAQGRRPVQIGGPRR